MSSTARQFVILRNWCDWQDDLTASGLRVHPRFFEACAQVRRDAAYLIGFMA